MFAPPDSLLRGSVVLIVSDEGELEQQVVQVLADQGCASEQGTPGLLLDPSLRYDACVLAMRRHRGWGSGMIVALRTAALPCATLMLLLEGDAGDVTAAIGSGVVDCMIGAHTRDSVLEGVSNAIQCTKRWRSRLSPLRVRVREPAPPPAIATFPIHEITSPVAQDLPQPRAREGSGPRIDAIVERLAEVAKLTPREGEVLYWLLQGHRYDDIASVMHISPRTTKFHASNLLRKLDLDSRFDLTRLLVDEH